MSQEGHTGDSSPRRLPFWIMGCSAGFGSVPPLCRPWVGHPAHRRARGALNSTSVIKPSPLASKSGPVPRLAMAMSVAGSSSVAIGVEKPGAP